ncbi:MAG TPA: SDR family oxidoreductase, partial [Micromonosporaceae bacterium]|nr:SDR family oxidoreductase [Micromonosporaceae bacterium]
MTEDSVVVVTGAASGIGRALAERFAADGARRVVVADRDGDGAARVAAGLPGDVGLAVPLDVADEAAVRDLAARLERDDGRIDLWCSNAGVAAGRDLGGDADWDLSWRVNVLAHLYAARAVLPGM